MLDVHAVDPHGVEWTVKRRWLPRYEGRGLRARLRQRPKRARQDDEKTRWYDWLDVPDVPDSFTALVVTILVIAGLVLLFLFGIPVLLGLVDLVVPYARRQ